MRRDLPLALFLTLAAAATGAGELDLESAMRLAAERPAARAAGELARAAEAAATVERRLALLPTLAARAARVERDRSLQLVTPVGGFEFGAMGRNVLDVELVWPLLDAPRLFHEAPARRHEADAARRTATRRSAALAAEAAGWFFDVLGLEARLEANASFVRSLTARLGEVAARVEVGRAVEADRLRLSLALADARQTELVLREARGVAALALGHAVGRDEAVEPRFHAGVVPPLLPPEAEAVAAALERRADLQALVSRRQAAERRIGSVSAELVPRLEARGAWRFDDGSGLRPDSYFEATLSATWVPFAGGARSVRAAARRAEAAALGHELQELRRAIAMDVRRALADFRVAEGERALAQVGVGEAEETARVSQARYGEGRETVNDLLENEAVLRDRRARLALADLARGRAWVALRLATGELRF
jgi:outer membrane protein TolC